MATETTPFAGIAEEREYPPSEDFVRQANVNDPKIHEFAGKALEVEPWQ